MKTRLLPTGWVVILLAFVMAFSCQDDSLETMSNPMLSSAEDVESGLTVKINIEGKNPVTFKKKPLAWDGQSKFKLGEYYILTESQGALVREKMDQGILLCELKDDDDGKKSKTVEADLAGVVTDGNLTANAQVGCSAYSSWGFCMTTVGTGGCPDGLSAGDKYHEHFYDFVGGASYYSYHYGNNQTGFIETSEDKPAGYMWCKAKLYKPSFKYVILGQGYGICPANLAQTEEECEN